MTLWQACTDTPTLPEPGVSLSLATARKASISDLAYDLTFQIPASTSEAIMASEVIRFTYSGSSDVQIDFKEKTENLLKIVVNGVILSVGVEHEHIVLPKKYLKAQNSMEIQFIAGDLSLNRNDEYVYTLLVPDRARTVFPVLDQPNLKSKWTLKLDIPEHWEAVANGPVLSTELSNERKIIQYHQTKLIPSYLFAFAAGKFHKTTNIAGDMTMYYRESDSIKVKRNTPEIFDLHRTSLDWLEDYTGIKYPFQKFDFALIPTFQYGGMEHPGAIFYRERSLMLDESASINQKLRRASLIAHETAHMWFGDLVTMDWFDDVWLKEVFANFMAAKMVNPSFPEINHDLRFLLSHYPSAYAVDRTEGTHPIQQPLNNLQNAGSLYGAIIYQKAPIMMRNLEAILGSASFREGLRQYLNTYAYGNATWDDLVNILQSYTDQNLDQWNHDWIKSGGMPEILIKPEAGALQFEVLNRTTNRIWPQQIETQIGQGKINFILKEKHRQAINGKPYFVNNDGRAYGYFNLESDHLIHLKETLKDRDEIGRAATWLMLWEAFLQQRLDTKFIYAALLESLESEPDPLILDYLAGNLQTVFWNFLDTTQRHDMQERTEKVLYSGMIQANDLSLKRTYYNAYSSIGGSREGVDNLFKIGGGQLPAFTLPLSENDKIQLTLQLRCVISAILMKSLPLN